MSASDKQSNLTAGEKILLERWKSSKGIDQDAKVVGEPERLVEGRRLGAVMFTDMVGYTALTQRDEILTLRILEEHRRLLRPLFRKYEGREIKTLGDGFMIEFPSALEAVQCSLEIQLAVSNFNANRPPGERFSLRIGIHLGDVIHKDNDVYGDAVNIASRVVPLCAPGSICVTEQVYSQVKNRLDKPFVSMGKRKLKNVETRVHVFSLSVQT